MEGQNFRLLEKAKDFYDLAYMCSVFVKGDVSTIRRHALSIIYLDKDEGLRHKFLGDNAYIDLKLYQKKVKEGKLEEFLDIFDGKKFDNISKENKLHTIYNSLNDSKHVFERILVNSKIEKYFPLERIENYINSRK